MTSAKESQFSPVMLNKLKNFYALTLDTNNDGLVNWTDFQAAIENMVPHELAERNSRLKILRKRLEQNFQKYFWDLCEVGDANKDGNIDMNEWLDVMSEIVEQVKDRNTFPEWYEGLHKALFRSNEFFDDRDVLKEEFINMMATWDIDADYAGKAYDFMTENGKRKMDYRLFSDMMKLFWTNEKEGHPVNMGLEKRSNPVV